MEWTPPFDALAEASWGPIQAALRAEAVEGWLDGLLAEVVAQQSNS